LFTFLSADERNSPPSLPAQEEVQADGSKTSGSSSSSSDSGSSSSVTLINYLVKRYLNLYYSCYCMLTSAFRFGQVFCLIYIILFVQILILVVPQPLGLMLGNREPKFILSGRITTPKSLFRYMLCFVLPSFYFVE